MEGAPAPNEKLEEARQQMQALAVQAGQVQRECGLEIVPADFCKEVLKFGLLEVSCTGAFKLCAFGYAVVVKHECESKIFMALWEYPGSFKVLLTSP